MSAVNPRTTSEQVAVLVQRRHRAADMVATLLSTRNSLEFYTAFYAALWGAMTMLAPDFIVVSYATRAIADLLHPNLWVIGMPSFIVGCVGMYALRAGNRRLRAWCAAIAALLWWMLAGWFLYGVEPPAMSGVAAYGAAALAEAWVYVRVTHSFDELARTVTHDRTVARPR